jgi:hypothetical protein
MLPIFDYFNQIGKDIPGAEILSYRLSIPANIFGINYMFIFDKSRGHQCNISARIEKKQFMTTKVATSIREISYTYPQSFTITKTFPVTYITKLEECAIEVLCNMAMYPEEIAQYKDMKKEEDAKKEKVLAVATWLGFIGSGNRIADMKRIMESGYTLRIDPLTYIMVGKEFIIVRRHGLLNKNMPHEIITEEICHQIVAKLKAHAPAPAKAAIDQQLVRDIVTIIGE